jgi:hypothetical protein
VTTQDHTPRWYNRRMSDEARYRELYRQSPRLAQLAADSESYIVRMEALGVSRVDALRAREYMSEDEAYREAVLGRLSQRMLRQSPHE